MKLLLLSLAAGLILHSPMNAQEDRSMISQNFLRSCRNYPYKLGIDFKERRKNSFKLLSTAIVEVVDDNYYMITMAYEEAKLRAKVNIGSFIQLTNNPKNKFINFDNYPVRANGRLIKNQQQFENRLNKVSLKSVIDLKGLRELDNCYKKGKYVMATFEVSDETIRSAEILNNYMKRN